MSKIDDTLKALSLEGRVTTRGDHRHRARAALIDDYAEGFGNRQPY